MPELSTSKSPWADRIQHLWNLRLDRLLSEFETEYQNFCAHYGKNKKLQFEIDLFEIARLRACGEISKAQDLAQKIQNQTSDGRVDLQMGLNYLANGDDIKAWIQFSAAYEKSRDSMTQILALGNKVLCLNHFGLDYKSSLEDLEKLTAKYKLNGGAGAAAIESQNLAQRQRMYFRNGEFDEMTATYKQNSHIKGQANFIYAWSLSLPYVSQSADLLAEIQKIIVSDQSLNLQQGRIQTLLKIFSDSAELNFHDRVDRLYLWVWTHLVKVRHVPLVWIESELEKLMSDTKSLASTEDLVMLRNVGGWFQLIRGNKPVDVTAALKNPSRVGEMTYSVFESEWTFIQDIYQQIVLSKKSFAQIAVSKHNQFFVQALFESDFELHLNQMALRSKVIHAKEWNLFADADFFLKGKEVLSDRALSLLVQAFERQTVLDFTSIAKDCLGAPVFDENIHVDLIQRLLLKLKKLISNPKAIVVRGDQVFLKTTLPVKIIQPTTLSATAKSHVISSFLQPDYQKSVKKVSKQKIPSFLLELQQSQSLNRLQIEQMTGWSKATANRKLAEYVQKNWLQKSGTGKQITYALNKDFK